MSSEPFKVVIGLIGGSEKGLSQSIVPAFNNSVNANESNTDNRETMESSEGVDIFLNKIFYTPTMGNPSDDWPQISKLFCMVQNFSNYNFNEAVSDVNTPSDGCTYPG